jgi:erythromycin esterase/glucose/sorbosone dehydrogenase
MTGAVDTEASRITFGRDGMLYMSISAPGSKVERSQDPNDYAGKTVRLRDDGSIPDDNPFVGRAGVKPGIFTMGHRNRHGLAVNPETGEMWETEQGPSGGAPQLGFYGLDVYSLNRSRDEVVRYLEKLDSDAERRAGQRYSCFDHFGEDEQAYGYTAGFDLSQSCRDVVVRQLKDLQQRAFEYLPRDGRVAEDDFFSAEQNASLVRNAAEYYRGMFQGRVNTWNLRDRHMAETLHALSAHLDGRFSHGKIVVWAHNSHLGNARATDRSKYGEWNLGNL